MANQSEYRSTSGFPFLVLGILFVLTSFIAIIALAGQRDPAAAPILVCVGGILLGVLLLAGLFIVQPNEGRVLQFFGHYIGCASEAGLRWANPFYTKRQLSLRVRSFEGSKLKVNDLDGNPVEIAAVIMWKVTNPFDAVFHVDNYEKFVQTQAETAVRNLASRFPYDVHDDEKVSLRGQTAVVADHLKSEIQDRLTQAGVQVQEARISHLAYAPEIAQAMLQRQQAGAIIAARTRIVEGAVGMVEMALAMLSQKKVVELDEERKAAMVSNLLVVLCGERSTQPIINAGTIY